MYMAKTNFGHVVVTVLVLTMSQFCFVVSADDSVSAQVVEPNSNNNNANNGSNSSVHLVPGDSPIQETLPSVASIQTSQSQIEEAHSTTTAPINPDNEFVVSLTSVPDNLPEFLYPPVPLLELSPPPQMQPRVDADSIQVEMPSSFSKLFQYYKSTLKELQPQPQAEQPQLKEETLWTLISSPVDPQPEESLDSSESETMSVSSDGKSNLRHVTYDTDDTVPSSSQQSYQIHSSGPKYSQISELTDFPEYIQSANVHGGYSDFRPRPAKPLIGYLPNFKNIAIPTISLSPYQGKQRLSVFSTLGKTLDDTFGGVWAARRALKSGTGAVLASKMRLGGTMAYVAADLAAKIIQVLASI